MSDHDAWRTKLEPPAGGLARLQREIDSRRDRVPRVRTAPAFAAAAAFAALAFGVTHYLRLAPQRAFERSLQTALATMPADDAVVERGIARELPSSRADVRIVELAPAATPVSPRP
ncbi:MAG TPA: hypothetical protein VGC55_16140 [Dokdonella sp.]